MQKSSNTFSREKEAYNLLLQSETVITNLLKHVKDEDKEKAQKEVEPLLQNIQNLKYAYID